MKWRTIDRETSQQCFEEFCSTKQVVCDDEYKDLRNDVWNLFNTSLAEIGITEEEISLKNNSYKVDYIFGLKLYTLLNTKYGMNVRSASTEGVWRYLSVCVLPDLVALRYGIDQPDRFWKKSKRLWLRVLWWYIYLSWQGNEDSTKAILKDNSTDEILQLVDRCGRGGYRVQLYRELMKKYGMLDPSARRKQQIFRKMMVLNTARVQVIEPELVTGGEAVYVEDLYNYFN